jgi:hypothetical protein
MVVFLCNDAVMLLSPGMISREDLQHAHSNIMLDFSLGGHFLRVHSMSYLRLRSTHAGEGQAAILVFHLRMVLKCLTG